MQKTMKAMLRRIGTGALALCAAAALAACSSSSSSFSMVAGLDNTVKIEAENSDPDTDGEGSINIGAAEILVVESDLSSGALKIRMIEAEKPQDGPADLEEEISGKSAKEYTLPEGEYKVYCTVSQKGTNGTANMYVKEGAPAVEAGSEEETAPAEETADGQGAALEEDGEASPIIEAATAIDEDLGQTWGEAKHVSYTVEENAIYIQIWEEGVDTEKMKSITNWEELKEDKLALAGRYMDKMKEMGIENGHLTLQYISNEETVSFLTIEDGEVTYDIFEAGDGEEESLTTGENGGYLVLSEEEQKAMIAEYTACKPEELEFVGNGTYDEDQPVAIFSHVDAEGNESDIRLLLFDNGSLGGYTPEGELVEVKDFFKQ